MQASEKSESGKNPYTPNPIQGFDVPPLPNEFDSKPVPYHTHNGIDSPKIDTQTNPFGGDASTTFVIGPASNLDSSDYDYITDGVDDDVEIQAAIDDLPSAGGSICFREGTYTLGLATITIAKNGVSLFGTGKGSIITCKTDYNKTFFKLGHASTQYSNCEIKNIYFDGNEANQSSGTNHIIDNDTLSVAILNLTITNNYFANSYSATIKDKGVGSVIVNNYFNTGDSSFIVLGSTSRYNITNNYFTSTVTSQKYVDLSGNGTFAYNHLVVPASASMSGVISNAGIGGIIGNKIVIGSSGASTLKIISSTPANQLIAHNLISFDGTPNVSSIAISSAGVILGNVIVLAGTGISITGSLSQVCNNRLDSLTGHGISLDGSTKCIVSNNFLYEIGAGTNDTYSGIILQNNSSNNIISNNYIREGSAGNKLKYGIREESSSDGPNIIIGNIVDSNVVTSEISTQNVSTDVSHNLTS